MAQSAGAIKAGSAFVELFLNDNKLTRGLDVVKRRFISFANEMKAIGKTIGTRGTGLLTPFIAGIYEAISAGSAIQKLAQRTGQSVESLSALSHGFHVAGGSAQEFAAAVEGLNEKALQATLSNRYMFEDFKRLGTGFEWLNMPIEARLRRLAEGIDQLDSAAAKMHLIKEAGFDQLSGYLMKGTEGLKEYLAESAKGAMTPDQTAASMEATRGLSQIWQELKLAVRDVGLALLPTADQIKQIRDSISHAIAAGREWIKNNKGMVIVVAAVAAGLFAAGTAFVVIGSAAAIAATAIGGIISAIGAVGTAIGTIGPLIAGVAEFIPAIVFVAGALALVGAGVVIFWKQLKAQAKQAAEYAAGAWRRFGSQPIKDAASWAWRNIVSAWGEAKSTLVSGFNSVKQTAIETWGGIANAFQAGDWTLAGQIAMAGLEVMWKKTILSLTQVWNSFAGGFSDTWAAITSVVAYALADVMAMFQKFVKAIPGASKALGLNGGLSAEELKNAISEDSRRAKQARDDARRARELDADDAVKQAEHRLRELNDKAEAAARGNRPGGRLLDAAAELARRGLGGPGRGLLPLAEQVKGATQGPIGQQLRFGDTIGQQQLDQLKDIAANAKQLPAIAAGINGLNQGLRVAR